MKFDLHCHSHFSDGKLTPIELVDYAVERNIELLALTDHDSIDGLQVAHDYIKQQNIAIKLIDGVEISALTDYGEVHIVGLAIDRKNLKLIESLNNQQQQRWQRAKDYAQKLSKIGVNDVLEYLENNVHQVVTRSHIAKSIVELGHAKDMEQAFKKYIGKQGKVKVTKNWMSLEDAVFLIQQAGGVSVLAHPTRYPLSNRKLSYLIENFASVGGKGIELSYPSLNKDKSEWLKIHREKNGLLASSGSDFHYPNLRWTDLGRFHPVDSNIPHIIDII